MKYLSQRSTLGLQLVLFARLQTHTKGRVGIFAYLSCTCATLLFAIASFSLTRINTDLTPKFVIHVTVLLLNINSLITSIVPPISTSLNLHGAPNSNFMSLLMQKCQVGLVTMGMLK